MKPAVRKTREAEREVRAEGVKKGQKKKAKLNKRKDKGWHLKLTASFKTFKKVMSVQARVSDIHIFLSKA